LFFGHPENFPLEPSRSLRGRPDPALPAPIEDATGDLPCPISRRPLGLEVLPPALASAFQPPTGRNSYALQETFSLNTPSSCPGSIFPLWTPINGDPSSFLRMNDEPQLGYVAVFFFSLFFSPFQPSHLSSRRLRPLILRCTSPPPDGQAFTEVTPSARQSFSVRKSKVFFLSPASFPLFPQSLVSSLPCPLLPLFSCACLVALPHHVLTKAPYHPLSLLSLLGAFLFA